MKLHFSASAFILLANLFSLNASDDIPNPPLITNTQCNKDSATITWKSTDEDTAEILRYSIQFSNSFKPDLWEMIDDEIPASNTTHSVSLPSGDYTFRVLAQNKNGFSHPSGNSNTCKMGSQGVPHKHPENVAVGDGSSNNLVIRWDPMPQTEHNGQGFAYNISWKRDIPGEFWKSELVSDWRQRELIINNVPPFRAHRVKVEALNEYGKAEIVAQEVIGYSGEDIPTLAPTNFTLVQVLSPTKALLRWDSVPADSVKGYFLGYKIRIWYQPNDQLANTSSSTSPNESYDSSKLYQFFNIRDAQITQALVDRFKPNTVNYAQICVYNGKFNGPLSEILSFKMPEGKPEAVSSLEAYPLGPTALYLQWKEPFEWNGTPVGYNIYYAEVKGTNIGQINAYNENPIRDPNQLHAVLGGLLRETKYRLYVTSVNKVLESTKYFIEANTVTTTPTKPAIPSFVWKDVTVDSRNRRVKVTLLPNFSGNPGSDFFYVQYKKKDATDSEKIRTSSETDYTFIEGLEPQQVYQFTVIAADGEYLTSSEMQEVICE